MNSLNGYRLSDADWRSPGIEPVLVPTQDVFEQSLKNIRHWSDFAIANRIFIDFDDRSNFGSSAAEENFVCDVKLSPIDLSLLDREFQH